VTAQLEERRTTAPPDLRAEPEGRPQSTSEEGVDLARPLVQHTALEIDVQHTDEHAIPRAHQGQRERPLSAQVGSPVLGQDRPLDRHERAVAGAVHPLGRMHPLSPLEPFGEEPEVGA
jgi:hypothetical protein